MKAVVKPMTVCSWDDHGTTETSFLSLCALIRISSFLFSRLPSPRRSTGRTKVQHFFVDRSIRKNGLNKCLLAKCMVHQMWYAWLCLIPMCTIFGQHTVRSSACSTCNSLYRNFSETFILLLIFVRLFK